MPAEVKSEVPTMYLEVLETGESGYVRDDTAGTPFEERINCAGVIFIPNTGKMAEPILNDKGEETGNYRNVNIRYIKNCPYIKEEEQRKLGYEKNRIPSEDTIAIKKGKSMVKKEGDIALFEYLRLVFYNLSAPNRPRSAKALFKVSEIKKQITAVNEMEFLKAKAVSYIGTLCVKVGKDSYKYKEAKIDNILTAINKFGGDDYSDKIRVLTSYAKTQPVELLEVAASLDNVTVTEVTHALELNVIRFEGITVVLVDSNKVLGTLPVEAKSQNKKIDAFAEMLRTPEYAQAYQELRAKLEIANENSLK